MVLFKTSSILTVSNASDILNQPNPTEKEKTCNSSLPSSDEKTKLAGIAAGAQVNVLESVKVNGTAQAIDANKAIDITMPTQVSDLTNDAGYITAADVPEASDAAPAMDGTASAGTATTWARADHVHPTDTTRAPLASPALTGTPTAPTAAAGTNTTQIATTEFVTDAINTAVSTVYNVKGSKATFDALPTTKNKTGDVWHVEEDGAEYFWDGSAWEFMGKVVDVSGFIAETDVTVATEAQINAMFAA